MLNTLTTKAYIKAQLKQSVLSEKIKQV
uniref:Fimbrial protein Flp n=1 Tax=Aggregatibacter actinomycetemcomitans TaxID=714 RepID=Q93GW4_AGGAC|nr:fimbrial protein Flp precursor [Aggregatibacter actinomycetemcomitans]